MTVMTFLFFQKVDEIKSFLPFFSIPEVQVDVVRDLSCVSGGLPNLKGNLKHVVFLFIQHQTGITGADSRFL